MNGNNKLLSIARRYHANLLDRIRRYLNERGIPDVLIDHHLLGWNGRRITIPVFNREGRLAFFRLAKDPEDKTAGSKMLATPGAHAELYGWDQVFQRPCEIVICEGEFDRLVLEARGFRAVTSTAGAGTFRPEWAKDFQRIPAVYISFDRDEAGRSGALRVGQLIPHAKLIELPEEVGEGGDVTDYFIRLGHSREDFLELLTKAKPAPARAELEPPQHLPVVRTTRLISDRRIDRTKAAVPITAVVEQYVKLRRSGSTFVGLCPFHEDHHPSLVVYPASGTFYCFGCAKHGDTIAFLCGIEHLSFLQALDALDRFSSQHGATPD